MILDRIDGRMPHLGTAVAVLDSERVLLVRRKDLEVWCLPGGLVEPQETVGQAALREVWEETGLKTELTRLVGVYSMPNWQSGGDNTVLFTATPTGGDLVPQEEEVLELGFFDPEDLPEPFLWWHKQRVADAVSGIGGSVVRQQGAIWPFDPAWGLREVLGFLSESGLSKEELYKRYWTRRAPGDGEVEVAEVRT